MDFDGGLFSPSMPSSSDAALGRGENAAEAEEAEDHGMRCLTKMVEPEKVAPLLSSDPQSLFSDGEQMLSFSSASKQEELMLTLDGTLPGYHHPSASASTVPHLRNAGLYSGSFDENMHRVLARVRGPFTPSQWLELERQALIYKCIVANAAIPPSLLISMRRGLGPAGFPPFSAALFGSTPLGWGQGYAGGNDDPEPGRCRRTDGKKWRCSRDAVADQKYCERHMNRGRHRSRKHVEGRRTGHAVKALPAGAPSQPPSTVSGGGNPGNVITSLHQTESLQTTDYPAHFDRVKMSKGNDNEVTQDSADLSTMLGPINSRPMGMFPISNEQNPFEEASSRAELGHIPMDSPLKPPCSSFSDTINTTTKFGDQHFINEWPKSQFEVEEMQFDRTQLSISIPPSCSDFVSSSSSDRDGLLTSPFKSSQEYNNIINMDLGAGVPEASRAQTSWAPVFWESSMAGPLGEVVLSNTRHTAAEQRKNLLSSSINFLTDGCDLTGWLESSPTGVLQKASFRSVSSSTGSSPRANNHEKNGSLCEDILGSAIASLPTIPS